jgi:pyruvate,orthophosphate dikinase
MAKRNTTRVRAKSKKSLVKRAAPKKARAGTAKSASKGKWVYSFGGGKADGKAAMRNLLGGKGAGLAEMANLGLPVPPASPSRPTSAPISTRTTSSTPKS